MIKDHLGNCYKYKTDMCKAYGISRSVFDKRMSLGWSLEEALTGRKNTIRPNSKACYDHLGNYYNSAADMCRANGISIELYRSRKKLGWTIEEILNNKKENPRVKEHIDYLGNVYKSESAMCRAHNVNRGTYRERISLGWTSKEALIGEKDPSREVYVPSSKTCTDHKGNKYHSIKEMCEKYGVNSSTFQTRLKAGYPLEAALTGVIFISGDKTINNTAQYIEIKDSRNRQSIDHLGKIYESETQMCLAYNISQATFRNRIDRLGWSLDDALTKPVHNYVRDHLNNSFVSAKEMCRYYGVKFDVFYRRRKLGWSLEEALTDSKKHVKPMAVQCTDHKGNHFDSFAEMCRFWHIDFNVFKDRVGRLEWTLEEALTIPKSYSLGEYRVSIILSDFCAEGLIDSFFHNITIKKAFDLLGRTKQYKEFMGLYELALSDVGVAISAQRLSRFRFDFTLVQDGDVFAFIEFDGKQHFTYIDVFFKTLSSFIFRHNSDIAKNTFAETNGIPLLRIRFDQDDISTIKYMISDLIKTPLKYVEKHNTFLTEKEYMSKLDSNEVFVYQCVSM